jgi:pimeloyl-ACP methyl ester carboxylesterase
MRRTPLRLLAAITGLWAPGALAASAELAVTPHEFKGPGGEIVAAERGVLQVPESRGQSGGRMIPLTFVRFKSTNPRPGHPIVYLAGGPGGSGIATGRGSRFPMFMALRTVSDVILLDQRGVGASNIIPPCVAPKALDSAGPIDEEVATRYYAETLRHCWSFWRGKGVDIAAYDTVQNAADLQDLRRALGAKKLNLLGISYGTHLALEALKQDERHIDRVVLASAEGPDQTVKLPARADAALGRWAERLARDPTAAKAYPDLLATMRRVHAKLDAAPAVVSHAPKGGPPVAFRVAAMPIQSLAGMMLKNPNTAARLPMTYAALDAGIYAPLAPVIYQELLSRPAVMLGMPEAMDLASGVSAERLALVRRQAPNSVLGWGLSFPMPQLQAAGIPGVDLGDRFRAPVKTARPTLLLSGDLDVRTPLEEQVEAVAGFRNLTHIVVENGGHDLFEADPRIADAVVRFFAAQPVDERRIALPPPRFDLPGR